MKVNYSGEAGIKSWWQRFILVFVYPGFWNTKIIVARARGGTVSPQGFVLLRGCTLDQVSVQLHFVLRFDEDFFVLIGYFGEFWSEKGLVLFGPWME